MQKMTGRRSEVKTGRIRLGGLLLANLAMLGMAHGQGSFPDPPAGFTWESQGVMVYSDSGSFTVDLKRNDIVGASSEVTLDETDSVDCL